MDLAFESLTILDLWSNDRFIILYDYTCNIFVVTVIFYDLVEVSFNWYFNFILYKTMLYTEELFCVYSLTSLLVFDPLILFLCIYFFVYIIMLLSLRTLIDIKDSFSYKRFIIFFLNSGMYWVYIQQEMWTQGLELLFSFIWKIKQKNQTLHRKKMNHWLEYILMSIKWKFSAAKMSWINRISYHKSKI